MSSSRPAVVVSLPARDAREAREGVRESREDGGDLCEVRFDRWRPEDLGEARLLFPSDLPLVATYRSRAEGGSGLSEGAGRLPVLLELARLSFAYLDVEIARDLPLADALARALHRPGAPQLLLSAHLTPDIPPREVHALLLRHSEDGGIVKLVQPCRVGELLAEVVPALPPPGLGGYVLHSTGPSGPLLRAWARRLGMRLVFAAPARHRLRDSVEESQIPCDELGRYLRTAVAGPLFALLGHPVRHSRSPALLNRWLAATSHDGLYIALDIEDPSEFARVLTPLAEGGFRGLNVTRPYKREAMALASRVARGAERCGCANVLTLREGEIEAENTDLSAMLRRLGELHAEGVARDARMTIVGAGGAARAAAASAAELSHPFEVVARDAGAARELAREFGGEIGEADRDRPAELLVHATPAGTPELPSLVGVEWAGRISSGTYVLDFVYAPHHRFLGEHASRVGARYEDGSRLLVYQAAESFALWTGTPLPPAEMALALREAS